MQLQIHYLLVGSRPLETTCTVANTCTTKFSMVNHGTQVLTRVDLLVANLNLVMYTYRTKFSRTQAFVSNRDQIHVSNRIKSVLNLKAKNSQRTISLLIFCKKNCYFYQHAFQMSTNDTPIICFQSGQYSVCPPSAILRGIRALSFLQF